MDQKCFRCKFTELFDEKSHKCLPLPKNTLCLHEDRDVIIFIYRILILLFLFLSCVHFMRNRNSPYLCSSRCELDIVMIIGLTFNCLNQMLMVFDKYLCVLTVYGHNIGDAFYHFGLFCKIYNYKNKSNFFVPRLYYIKRIVVIMLIIVMVEITIAWYFIMDFANVDYINMSRILTDSAEYLEVTCNRFFYPKLLNLLFIRIIQIFTIYVAFPQTINWFIQNN
ncbi:hypothetical protein A3Q56_02923 [Intoshia linei]|uniref:Uncharacterized protein n=1 Tax=Intoshia linei TaxID=1819745 RepID=A0A177B512_9BILA|nr:hypothetical protein A3Q56_02923 [Intoshia linei]